MTRFEALLKLKRNPLRESWKKKPITEKQEQLLEDAGYDDEEMAQFDRGMAAVAIDMYFEDERINKAEAYAWGNLDALYDGHGCEEYDYDDMDWCDSDVFH